MAGSLTPGDDVGGHGAEHGEPAAVESSAVLIGSADAGAPPTATVPAREDDRESDVAAARAHARRFRIAFTLVVLLGGLIVGAGSAFLLTRPQPADPAVWAGGWKPTHGGTDGARQIAAQVAGAYHLDEGAQIVDVRPVANADAGQDVGLIAVYDPAYTSGFRTMRPTGTLTYKMCGTGANCAIGEGTASEARGTLLRREALELALLSFHFLHDVDHVVVLLPPKLGETASFALFFERSDMHQELHVPLRQTLPAPAPTPGALTESDTASILQLTGGRLFHFGLQRLQDQTLALILDTPNAASSTTGSNGSSGATTGSGATTATP